MKLAWPVGPIGDVLRRSEDWISIDPGKVYKEVTVKLWGRGVVLRREIPGAEIRSDRRARVRGGQFILSRIDARNGALGVVPVELDGAVVSNDFPAFTPDPLRLDVDYLGLLSRTQRFVDLCRAASEGTTNRVRLKEDRFLSMQIALPPLPEQRRIVLRVSQLAGRITEANKLRATALAESDSLLAAGLRRVEKDLMPRFARTLGEAVLSFKNGIARRPDGLEEGPIVLRLADLASGEISLSSPRRGSLSIREVEDYDLVAGDLLFLRVNGSRSLVGRCVPFRGANEPICFNDHLIRGRVDPEVADWRFVAYLSNSPGARAHFEARAITTAGQLTVNHSIISAMPLPIPGLTEQKELVGDLERLKHLQAQLRRSQAQTSTELDALMPAVLEKAMAGEL